jgi:hypothetical protein
VADDPPMRLTEYYRGLPLNLTTRLPPEEVARRINDTLPSPFRPFATGIVGRARAGRLKLFYRSGLFGYNGMPILTGPIEPHPSGTLLRLLYRGRLSARLAFPLAFLAVGLGAILSIVLGGGRGDPDFGPWLALLLAAVAVVVMALPIAIHAFAIRNAEAQLAAMAAFLRTALDARDAPGPAA